MGCAAAGDLRAFLDGELDGAEVARVELHLASCPSCRLLVEGLRVNASFAGAALHRLAPPAAEVPRVTWGQIRDRAEGRLGGPVTLDGRVLNVFGNLFRMMVGSRMRMASSAVAVLVAVALLFSLSPVQTAASSFLSIFRVKKLAAVTVDPASLPNLALPSDVGSFNVVGDGKPRQVSSAQAEKAIGFAVPAPGVLPEGLQPQPVSLMVTDATSVTFTPDLKRVQAYLSSIGATDVKLPDSLDGAPITMQMPPTVRALYLERGGADRQPDGTVRPLVGQRHLFLGATASPTMSVPDGLDVERIRTELLKVPGLPPDLVNQIKAIEDWRNTVVVPVVKGVSREVTVQGEKGLLISDAAGQGRTLLWLKGGVIYTLTGNVPEAEILAAANSVR